MNSVNCNKKIWERLKRLREELLDKRDMWECITHVVLRTAAVSWPLDSVGRLTSRLFGSSLATSVSLLSEGTGHMTMLSCSTVPYVLLLLDSSPLASPITFTAAAFTRLLTSDDMFSTFCQYTQRHSIIPKSQRSNKRKYSRSAGSLHSPDSY